MRKIDRLGRIVIPMDLRKKYGFNEGVKIEFFDVGDGITVKPVEPICKICRAKPLGYRQSIHRFAIIIYYIILCL